MALPRRFLLSQTQQSLARVWTQRKYSEHLLSLKASGILREILHANWAVSYGSYFSVPKDESVDRAIFNGRSISKLFEKPPSVNLVRLPVLLQILHKLTEKNPQQTVFVATGDFRHWFHQLKNGELERFFGIAIAGAYYLWTTWPMGFSWSPFAAQTCAWLILIDNLMEFVVTDFLNDAELPSVIPLAGGMECGFIVVYYDNYLIATTDQQNFVDIQHRLWQSFHNHHVKVKEHYQYLPHERFTMDFPFEPKKDLYNNDVLIQTSYVSVGFEYLGLIIRIVDGQVSWKVAMKGDYPLSIPSLLTPRGIAGFVGKILAGFMPGGSPLGGSGLMLRTIDCLRLACRWAHQRGSWDDPIQLPAGHHESLQDAWTWFLKNDWRFYE